MTTKVTIKAEVHQKDRAVRVQVKNPNGGQVYKDVTLIDTQEVEAYVHDGSMVEVTELVVPKRD